MPRSSTTFKPGQSGNPGGKSKAQKALELSLRERSMAACVEGLPEIVKLAKAKDDRVRLAAWELLGKWAGANAPKALEVSGADGGPLQFADAKTRILEKLSAIAAADRTA